MECERFREALSARLDGEDTECDPAVLDRHLRSCFACRQWENEAVTLGRAVRVRPAEAVPDLSASILAAIGSEPRPRSEGAGALIALRVALAVVAALQVVLAGSDLLSGAGHARGHLLHEVGSFDLALAIGFVCAAWRPARAYGLLPVVAAVAVGLVGTALVDVSDGHAATLTEGTHLLERAGFALLWLLARRAPENGLGRGPGGWRAANVA